MVVLASPVRTLRRKSLAKPVRLYSISGVDPVPLRDIPRLARELLEGEGDELCLTCHTTRTLLDGSEETTAEDAGWVVLWCGRVRLDLLADAVFGD